MTERFSSRWALILAAVGMAIGTGNIWRFPRVAAANGGGAFLIPWLLFLFIWSIPLLVAEFHLGRSSRKGPMGAFATTVDRRSGWMGGFVVITSLFIFAYYSVVTGWCLEYLFSTLAAWRSMTADTRAWWTGPMSGSGFAALGQAAALLVAALVIQRGVVGGLERVNRVVIPLLFATLVGLGVYTLTQEGAGAGVRYLFVPEWSRLLIPQTWLEAASQSAWSTGAGWGLMLVYASYARDEDSPVTNCLIAGLGNNGASILAALVILPTTFALLGHQEALDVLGSGNQGLTFITLPGLFSRLPGGWFVSLFFFLALVFAAFSSLLSMMELGVRTLGDAGIARRRATWITAGFGLAAGLPSALSMKVFNNQDWVWGVGLLLTGFLISLGVVVGGLRRFLDETVGHGPAHLPVKIWLAACLAGLIPLMFVMLLGWWFTRAITQYDPHFWWHPLREFSVGTCAVQWSVGIVAAILLARFAAGRRSANPSRS